MREGLSGPTIYLAIRLKYIESDEKVAIQCYHCGDPCENELIRFDAKDFCCGGCKAVYELFQETELKEIYDRRNEFAKRSNQFDFLSNATIADELLYFKSETHNRVKLYLPSIHCSSCIYLLENLHRLDDGVIKVTVNFVKKEADILYKPDRLSLHDLANLLGSIGYAPNFTRADGAKKDRSEGDGGLSIKLGVAAFCFGNIMLLSFPEYLGFDSQLDEKYGVFFSWLNIILALPVLLYSSIDYFKSAIAGLSRRFVNIDVPIVVGIITLFLRSVYEVLSEAGPGYFDSLAGLVFFLLVGKWFQSKTYQNLSFERDYKSYFPLAILKRQGIEEISTPIDLLEKDDTVIIRNGEIIPADGILSSGTAKIDYSFVTGESRPVHVNADQVIYAGGRQLGQRIELKLLKKSSQSYLTNLWNSQAFKEESDGHTKLLVNQISKYFTGVVLTIAILSFTFWAFHDSTMMWQSFTAVLIVACPCALALSAPFTNGNVLRWLGKANLYLKGSDVVERLSIIDTVVFDKTGTLTSSAESRLNYSGYDLSHIECAVVKKMTSNSTHPLSQKIHDSIAADISIELHDFVERPGKGLFAKYGTTSFKLGSAKWVGNDNVDSANQDGVYLSADGKVKGVYRFQNAYRDGLSQLTKKLGAYKMVILSGDNDRERENLTGIFGDKVEMKFNQSPEDKMNYIAELKNEGKSVMMLGDGLNDAGALKRSDIGLAVTEDIAAFSPACDGILLGSKLTYLSRFLRYLNIARNIVVASFIISFAYNIVGISLAVSGALTPVSAAILMPLSSISVVLFATLSSNYFAKTLNIV